MIQLDGVWNLHCPARNLNIPISIPGDVYTALLDQKLIPDPYYSTNEKLVQWLWQVEWIFDRKFDVKNVTIYLAFVLDLEMVDTFTTVYINDQKALNTTSCFKFYRTNIINFLKEGRNDIRIEFHLNYMEARNMHDEFLPNVYPNCKNCDIPFINYIRKPQFHAGWDWGPCIFSIGIYDHARIYPIPKNGYHLVELSAEQIYEDNDEIRINVDVYVHNYESVNTPTILKVKFDNEEKEITIPKSEPGEHVFNVMFSTNGKERWNIFQFGKQTRYELTATLFDQKITKKIGIRKL